MASNTRDFQKRVMEEVLKIPKGKVSTYGALAKKLHTSPRAVGQALKRNKEPDRFPCYKVVYSDGEVGNYSGPGGQKEKIRRLKKDGVQIANGTVDRGDIWN